MLISLPLTVSQHSNRQWYLDLPLLLTVLILLSVGFVMISSASFSFGEHRLNDDVFFLKRHLMYLCLGALFMFVTYLVPAKLWSSLSRLWIVLSLLLLVMVLVPGIGRELNGSRRWLAIGGFTIQVSELVKVAMVVFLSTYLTQYRREATSPSPPPRQHRSQGLLELCTGRQHPRRRSSRVQPTDEQLAGANIRSHPGGLPARRLPNPCRRSWRNRPLRADGEKTLPRY